MIETRQLDNSQTRYTYDPENQLTRIDFPGGAFAEYAYDSLGRRIQKNVNGTLTRYVYDNEDILEEFDGTNTLRARWTHGPGIDEPLAMERDLDLNGSLETQVFYLQDGLGSVTALTDTAGNIVERYDYDSFGNLTIKDSLNNPILQSAFGNPFTFTGREFDPESGLYFYRRRYYDPKRGRFLQEDPFNLTNVQLPAPMFPEIFRFNELDKFIAFRAFDKNIELLIWNPLQLMQYNYVLNNPVNFVDPTGLATDWDKVGECVGSLIIPALAATCGPSVKFGPKAVLACTLFVEAGLLTACIQFASKPDCDSKPNERGVTKK